MKITCPKNNVIKTRTIPNWLIVNRFTFVVLKLFLLSKSALFFKIKFKQFKPILKAAKKYKDFEIVTVNDRNGQIVKVFL